MYDRRMRGYEDMVGEERREEDDGIKRCNDLCNEGIRVKRGMVTLATRINDNTIALRDMKREYEMTDDVHVT